MEVRRHPKPCKDGCQRPLETRGARVSRCPDCGAFFAYLEGRYEARTAGARVAP